MSGEEKRIYVVVAETVQPDEFVTIEQVPGRLAAQCAHVVSKVRVGMLFTGQIEFSLYQPITTIVLSVKDSKELEHIQKMLYRLKYRHDCFFDTNEEVYGYNHVTNAPYSLMTALATYPITQSEISDVLGYLPLWSPKLVA